jgi:hypothetical protein
MRLVHEIDHRWHGGFLMTIFNENIAIPCYYGLRVQRVKVPPLQL